MINNVLGRMFGLLFLVIVLSFPAMANNNLIDFVPPSLHGPIMPPDTNEFPLTKEEISIVYPQLSEMEITNLYGAGPVYQNTFVPTRTIGLVAKQKKDGSIISIDEPLNSLPLRGTATVQGVVTTYPYGGGKKFVMRGIKVELWEDVSLGDDNYLSTVYTEEETVDEWFGLSKHVNYVDENNVWFTLDHTGYFTFESIEVGEGMDLYIKIIFEGYEGGSGYSQEGDIKLMVRDDNTPGGNVVVYRSENFHLNPGEDSGILLIESPELGSNGLADEAAHIYYDLWRAYGYFRDATGYNHDTVHAFIDYGDDDPPVVNTGNYSRIDYNEYDTGYLTYNETHSIVHEYAHTIHLGMRNGIPPYYTPCPGDDHCELNEIGGYYACENYPGQGDCNHGSCHNPTSVDAIIEGWARFVPTMILHDKYIRWGPSSDIHNIESPYNFDPACNGNTYDRDEYFWAAVLYGNLMGIGEGYNYIIDWSDMMSDTFNTHDPERSHDYYLGFINDWGYGNELTRIVCTNLIDYDTNPPPQPQPQAPDCSSDTTVEITGYAVEDGESFVMEYYYSIGNPYGYNPISSDESFTVTMMQSDYLYVGAFDDCLNENIGLVWVCIQDGSTSLSMIASDYRPKLGETVYIFLNVSSNESVGSAALVLDIPSNGLSIGEAEKTGFFTGPYIKDFIESDLHYFSSIYESGHGGSEGSISIPLTIEEEGNYTISVINAKLRDPSDSLYPDPNNDSVTIRAIDCDKDNDGYEANTPECGGDDCDDDLFYVHPGQPEFCNGYDDDCNGQVDDDLMLECGTNQGECEYGHQYCQMGEWSECLGGIPPAEEVCDGLDNDCNEEIDNGLPADECSFACQAGGFFWTGNGNTLNCCGDDSGEDDPYEATEISCDNHDNDCDGAVDLDLYRDCSELFLGICGQGVASCGAGQWLGCPAPVAEVCDDTLDNDCDGLTDLVDPNCQECIPDQTQGCELQEGVCEGSYEVCDEGFWPGCEYSAIPGYEVSEMSCEDGHDNDCDGLADGQDPDCDLYCGKVIYEDTLLTRDLTGCSDYGLLFGTNNITLDCMGHMIQGNLTPGSKGVMAWDDKDYVTIKNCDIRGFDSGVYTGWAEYTRILNNSLTNNLIGVYRIRGPWGYISNNIVKWNLEEGMSIEQLSENTVILGNIVINNSDSGIRVASNNITISDNVVENNMNHNIGLFYIDYTTLINNTVGEAFGYSYGIRVQYSDYNVILNNSIRYKDIALLGSKFNDVSGNTFYNPGGILYLSGASTYGNRIWNNSFLRINGNTAFESDGVTNNSWDVGGKGNYWIDFENNPGYPDHYEVDGGGEGVDYYPVWPPFQKHCGDSITEDTVLINDIFDCEGDALVINADDVVLDCDGHRVSGNNNTYGKGVFINNSNNVTIKNCDISSFYYGIYLDNSFQTIFNNSIRAIARNGIWARGDMNRFEYNVLSDVVNEGFYIQSSDNNVYSHNEMVNNGKGIRCNGGNDNVIEDNVIVNSTSWGMELHSSSRLYVSRNTIMNSGNDGLYARLTLDYYVYNNTIANGAARGIDTEYVFDGEISGNLVVENAQEGMYINQNSGDLLIWDNSFVDNGVNAYVIGYANHPNQWDVDGHGNYWSDFSTNPNYPDSYLIPGPAGEVDHYPLGPGSMVFNDVNHYYALNEQGDIAEDFAGGIDGVIEGAPFNMSGFHYAAREFDGVSDWAVDLGPDSVFFGDDPDSLTISTWVNVNDFAGVEKAFLSTYNGNPDAVYVTLLGKLDATNNVVRFITMINGDVRVLASDGSMNTREWYHVVGTWEKGGSQSLYLDGVLVDQLPAQATGDLTDGGTTRIGRRYRTGFPYDWMRMNGLVDEIAVWDRALSQDEVIALYNDGQGFFLPGTEPSWAVQCGDVIADDVVLLDDLVGCEGNALRVVSDDVTLDCQGHSILDDGVGYNEAAIFLDHVSNVTVKNCILEGFTYGVHSSGETGDENEFVVITNNTLNGSGISFFHTDNSIVSDNTMFDKGPLRAMEIYESLYNLITDNKIYSSGSIHLYMSYLTNITNNDFVNITGAALYFDDSGSHVVRGNTFVNVTDGIILSMTHGVVARENVFEGCGNSAMSATYFSSSSVLDMNIISDCAVGFTATYDEHAMTVSNNLFKNNSQAINTSAYDSLFYGNTFYMNEANAFEGADAQGHWNLSFMGNFWGDFYYNEGYPDVYLVPGPGPGIDYHPLGSPHTIVCGDPIYSDTVLTQGLVGCQGDGLRIVRDDVTLDCNGFGISGDGLGQWDTGVYVDHASNVTVKDCAVEGFPYGISSWGSYDDVSEFVVTMNNSLLGGGINYYNTAHGLIAGNVIVYSPKSAIDIADAPYTLVVGNTVLDSTGVTLYNSVHANISGNAFERSSPAMRLSETSDDVVEKNNFGNSDVCVRIETGNNVVLRNNSFVNCSEEAVNVTFWSSSITLEDNTFAGSGVGLVSDDTGSALMVYQNLFADNTFGIVSDASGSLFFNNTFLGNAITAFEASNDDASWNLSAVGNYWDDFALNPGFPYYYEIPGPGQGVDYHPLNVVEIDGLAENLSHYYALENDSLVIDEMTRQDGIIEGDPVLISGMNNLALDFDGVDDRVNLGDMSGLFKQDNDFTVSVWVRFDESNALTGIWGYYVPGQHGPYFRLWKKTDNSLRYVSAISNQCAHFAVEPGIPYQEGVWYNIVTVYEHHTNASLYVNGVFTGSDDLDMRPECNGFNAVDFLLGDMGLYPGDIALDEAAFWARALDEQEIETLYSEGYGVYYPFTYACPDGTAQGECSEQKPLLCVDGVLVDACRTCGCPTGLSCVQSSGRCVVKFPNLPLPSLFSDFLN